MPKRIDRLTPEQEARMAEWRDRWISIGLSTEPADRPTFEAAVADCYRHTGLPAPKRVVWVRSPLVGALAFPIAAYLLELRKRLEQASVGGAVGDAVRGAVDGAVRGAVDGAVGGAVRGAVGDAVGDAVGGAVRGAVRGARTQTLAASASHSRLASSIRKAVREVLGRLSAHRFGGQFWVGGWWYGAPAYVSFFTEVCALELTADMSARALAYERTCRSACWWWPHRDFVIACDRPAAIRRDDRGRLHSDEAASIEFRDGWALHHVHGVRVPRRVVEAPETLTVAEIKAETNAEVRRVMRERFGEGRYLLATGAKVVHQDHEKTRKGAAPRVLLKDDEGQVFLVGTDGSTGRTYYMACPREVETCAAAHAALCGFDESRILNKS